jgi:hypothetical protein
LDEARYGKEVNLKLFKGFEGFPGVGKAAGRKAQPEKS